MPKPARPAAAASAELPLVVFFTHHKTGSVWMNKVGVGLAKAFGSRFAWRWDRIDAQTGFYRDDARHSMAELRERFPGRRVRGVHIVRDPRDVIISGCHYHQKTEERWVHVPRERYGGLSYQQALLARPDWHQKMLLELDRFALDAAPRFEGWNYHDPDVYEARYEDLIDDAAFIHFEPIMRFLGFEGDALVRALAVVRTHSLFGDAAGLVGTVHVRSGRPAQWRESYTPALRQAFAQRLPGLLQQLGYEPDDRWVQG